MQFIGTSYRQFSAPRTEYNTLAPLGKLPDALAKLESLQWTEAVFSDMRSESEELAAIKRWVQINRWYLRTIREDTAYGIETTGTFQDYLDRLGKNTRLKLYNRRKVFESHGTAVEENFWPGRATEFLELLNDFHRVRWGSPCFSDRSIAFHLDFLSRGLAEGIRPLLMVLYHEHRPVSVLYNLVHDGCVYNIQSGYEETFHKKVALGTLHLGYSIEAAFEDPDVAFFDLLAGDGKNTDYKLHLATSRTSLTTVMLVRSRVFRLLYRAKDFLAQIKPCSAA